MNIQEGRGYVLRTGTDTPLAGWMPASRLDASAPWRTEPLLALRTLAETAQVFPGGLDLLWDLPASHVDASSREHVHRFLDMVGHLPGLRLHFCDAALGDFLLGPLSAWFHGPSAPTGPLGQAWRQGWLGWVPDAAGSWSLPHTVYLQAEPENGHEPLGSGCIWGELVLPLGALPHVNPAALASLLSDAQARLERALSLRMNGGAWPEAFLFQRRRAVWRIALMGGWEYQGAGGSWEDAASRVRDLAAELGKALRGPVQVGACADLEMGHLLGHQAMREGLPWRNSLPLPPARPSFSPCFGASPRQPSSHEARALFPAPMASVLDAPPVAWLRLPAVPQEAAVESFLRMIQPAPGLHWLPPDATLPGPFLEDHPWAQSSLYPPLADPTQALQPSLFADLD